MIMKYRCCVAFFMVYAVGLAASDCSSQCTASTCWDGVFEHMGCEEHCKKNGYSCPPDTSDNNQETSSSTVNEVKAFNKNWANLMKSHDMDGINQIYTQDCTYIIESIGSGTGIQDMMTAYTNWFAGNANFDHVEFTVTGAGEGSGLVFGYGKMITHFSNTEKTESDDYVKFFKRVDGKLVGHIDVIHA